MKNDIALMTCLLSLAVPQQTSTYSVPVKNYHFAATAVLDPQHLVLKRETIAVINAAYKALRSDKLMNRERAPLANYWIEVSNYKGKKEHFLGSLIVRFHEKKAYDDPKRWVLD